MTQTPDSNLARRVIDCAMKVHRGTGPGLEADVYRTCMAMELAAAGLPFERRLPLSPTYKGHDLNLRFSIDFVVADSLVLEVRAVDQIDRVHEMELHTYVHFGDFPYGLLLNFNVVRLEDGILRINRDDVEARSPKDDVFDCPEFFAADQAAER